MASFTRIFPLLHGLFISFFHTSFMRCDLHVHSTGSGMCNTPGLEKLCLESYNQPSAVYERCKRLGMSLVTLTDHDSIDGAEELRGYDDFFLSEEVSCKMPSGTEMHVGVYDISEHDHVEVQRRRNDFLSLVMYLTERQRFFAVNHVFSGLTGPRHMDDFEWFASYVPAFETRNGQMPAEANRQADELARELGKARTAGSDSHTLAGVGRTYTEVPRARTIDEFFGGLRAGFGTAEGEHGGYGKLTADIFRVGRAMFADRTWTLALLPLSVLVPAITGAHWFNELRFCSAWSHRVREGMCGARMLWELDANLAS